MDYEIKQIDKNTWAIENSGVRFFLLTGTQKALMIDSGMTTENAEEIVKQLTDLPIELINTHADIDHIAGNNAFGTALMHPAEYVNYFQGSAFHPTPTPVWDGDIIDLGGRPLRIITQPGHTPGSIALLDINRRTLFSADSIQDGSIFLFGAMRNIIAYRQSLDKVWACREEYDAIIPSHGSLILKPDIIPELMSFTDKIVAGEIPFREDEIFGIKVKVYETAAAVFICD
ncbi:MAG: MBL fold metallo-hydrolase [Clostridiales bacterium]|nr:MBL fold metallo-hydrolase [Clostridiales bacterium]